MVFSEGAAFTRTFLIEDEHKGFLFGDTTAVDRQFVIREFSIRYLQKGNLSKGNHKGLLWRILFLTCLAFLDNSGPTFRLRLFCADSQFSHFLVPTKFDLKMTTISCFLAIKYQFSNTSNHFCFEKLNAKKQKIHA